MYIINNMAADALVMQGTRASAGMVMIKLAMNILRHAQEGLIFRDRLDSLWDS